MADGKITGQELDTSLSNTINSKAPINNPTFTGTVGGITASMVGLGNVTNESKTTMFTSPTFTGTVSLPSTTSIGNVSSTELGYLGGVTSSIQTQLGEKVEQTTNLINGTNLNNVITSGFYRTQTFTNVIPNSTQAYGQLVVSRGGDTVVQIYTDWQAARSFMRTGNPAEVGGAGVWSQWKMLTPIYDGDAPIYACRAWVNFDGTGTVAIRASGNVSSITDNGTGDYTVNFTTAMPDANYVCNVTASRDNAGSGFVGSLFGGTGRSTTQARVASFWSGSASTLDAIDVHVAIFR